MKRMYMKTLKKFCSLLLALALVMGLNVPALAAVEDTGFSDVAADAWYAEAVMYCREHGLMAGIGNRQFAPESNLTRAQLAAVLYRIAGSPAVTGQDTFTDTVDGAWYSDAVLWASRQGLVSGYGGGRFGPNDPVTREQMTAILWRYAGSPTVTGNGSFNDTAQVASYAATAAVWASVNSIVRPISGNVFSPKSNATRAQVADALMNYDRSRQSASNGDKNPATDFDLEKGTVLLNNGIEMPILGIGTYRLSSQQAENSVYWALRDGYRLIDTARIYGNEDGVGRGIRRAIDEGIVTREEVFVTTKMWTADYGNGAAAIDASLERLGLDYIDLMILHHSQPGSDVAAYQAMEQAVSQGKLRSIGLSNFYTGDDFDRLVNATTITPALLQNETHPYYQSTAMKEHLKQYGTVLESWYPLGGRGHTQELFNDSTISSIAAAHSKTSAQVLLRWHLQAGNIAIPGSSSEAHIQENFEIFDFELTDEEMAQMTALDKNQRFAAY